MPRVNRELQKRLDQRRERERRRTPTERKYRFTSTSERSVSEETVDEVQEERSVEERSAARKPSRVAPKSRGSIAPQAARPFSEYGAEYAYVYRDLRRVTVVLAILLVLIGGLWMILPR